MTVRANTTPSMLKITFFHKTEPEQNQNKKTPPKNRIVMRFSGGCLLFVLYCTLRFFGVFRVFLPVFGVFYPRFPPYP